MIHSDPKHIIAALMVGKPKPEPEESDDNQAQEAAAKDFLDAVKADDPKALAEALRSFLDVCDYDDQGSDDDQEESQ